MSLTFHDFYEDRTRWLLWMPVLLGTGIAIYFALPEEPLLWIGIASVSLFALVAFLLRKSLVKLIPLACLIVSVGFLAANYRTVSVGTRMLNYPLPPLWIEGVVEHAELKASKNGKLSQWFVLRDLYAPEFEELPQKARLVFRGKGEMLKPGARVKVYAKLMPVQLPVTPGTYDFRRQSYFQGVGATGFVLKPPEVIALPASTSWQEGLEQVRETMTQTFLREMTPPDGAIAAALVTGDRAAIPEPVRVYFVDSGLAHVLAISGLHLTIVAGLVFFVVRRCLALIPGIALKYPIKKWAAFLTILMTFVYLGISGFGLPAQRSTIMTTAVMVAIIIDRTAISMRSVCLAATFILLIIPEAILSPSFQLSFAAVVGLIGAYESCRNPFAQWINLGGTWRKILAYFCGIVFSSLIATISTIPYTIYTFNRFTLHAIEANLLAIPLVGTLIMPSAVLTSLLMLVDLEWLSMPLFEYGIELLVSIARTVSSWPGANIFVATPSVVFLSLFTLGGMWLVIWRTRLRYGGLLLIALSFIDLALTTPPHILINEKGNTVAIRLPSGEISLSGSRLKTFTSEQWQRQTASQELVRVKDSFTPVAGGYAYLHPLGYRILILEKETTSLCAGYDIVLSAEPLRGKCQDAAYRVDKFDVWRAGAHALWLEPKGVRIETVQGVQGNRPWSHIAVPQKERKI